MSSSEKRETRCDPASECSGELKREVGGAEDVWVHLLPTPRECTNTGAPLCHPSCDSDE